MCYITFTFTLHNTSHYLALHCIYIYIIYKLTLPCVTLHLHFHYISAHITLRSPINSHSDEEEMAERIQFGTKRNKMDCRGIIKFNCAIFEQSHNFFRNLVIKALNWLYKQMRRTTTLTMALSTTRPRWKARSRKTARIIALVLVETYCNTDWYLEQLNPGNSVDMTPRQRVNQSK